MRREWGFWFLAIVLALAVQGQEAPPAAAAGELREVVLNRPFSRGDAYDLVFDLEGSGRGTLGIGEASSGKSHHVSFHLEGKARVLAVSERGEPTLLLFQVGKARLLQEDKETALDLDGAEVGVSYPSGKPRFVRRDGKALPKEAVGFLAQAFPAPRELDEDALLGPGRPVKAGESWTLPAEALSQVLFPKEQSEMAKSARLEGTTTFAGEEVWEGAPGLRLRSEVKASELRLQNFVGTIGVQVSDDLWLAADRTSHRSKRTTTTVSELWGKFLSGDGKAIDVKSKDTVSVKVEVR